MTLAFTSSTVRYEVTSTLAPVLPDWSETQIIFPAEECRSQSVSLFVISESIKAELCYQAVVLERSEFATPSPQAMIL